MISTEQLRKAIEECVQKRPSGQSVVFTSKFVEALARELLASREARPVFFIDMAGGEWINVDEIPGNTFDFNNLPDGITFLYTAPPAPEVPEEMTGGIAMSKYKVKKSNYVQWVKGFNACRAEMLAAAPEVSGE
ncbi:hypothetical protein JEP96_12650 [Serratia marcescens]|nr:hypothetical protein [Serratia marcescens]